MLRILHVIDSLQIGGTEWQCVSLLKHLDASRFQNHLVCLNGGGPLLQEVHRMGLPSRVIPFARFCRPGFLKSLIRMALFMRQQGIQIVQAYGFYSNVPALLAGWLARVPIMVGSRRDMGEFLSPGKRLIERGVFKLADRVVANAKAIEAELLAARQVRADKIVVIPSGVDLNRFDSRMPSADRPLWVGKGKVVAMVAKFRRAKDHATFLHAARQILDRDPTVVFVLVGDGYLKEETERLAKEGGISASVWFLGAVDPQAIPALLEHVDISVLASKKYEGIPNVVLESMAAGKPVVATDAGGCREAVLDDITGFLVPPGDPAQLAEKILQLLRDEREASRMGRAGRERVEAEFSLARMTQRFSSLYTDLARAKLKKDIEV